MRRNKNQHKGQKKQKIKQLEEVFQTVVKNFSKKEAEKPSQPISNTTTQMRVANTKVTQWMQKQQSNNEAPITRELTKTRPMTKDKVVASPNKNN